MRKTRFFIFLFFIFFFILLLFSTLSSFSHADEGIPDIISRVNDFADMLIPYEEIQLEKLLEENEKASTNKIVVITIDKFMGEALEDYSMSLAEKWKISQENKDNAIILLIGGRGREIHIEAGSDLKDALPDSLCSSIIRKEIVPFFNGGSYFLGIKNGLNSIIKEIEDFYTYQNTKKDISGTLTFKTLAVILSILAGFLVLGSIIFFNPRIAKKIWSILFRNNFHKVKRYFNGVCLGTKGPSSEELRKQYKELSTEELINFFKTDYTLIKPAKKILRKELENRGIKTKTILNKQDRSKSDKRTKPVPKSLKIIAGFFILIGIVAIIDILRSFGNFRIDRIHLYFNLNVSCLGLFIGPGLLRYSRRWRVVALVFIWFMLIVCPIIIAVSFFKCSFAPSLEISNVLNLVFSSFLFIGALWAYLVLNSNDIRELFGVSTYVKSKRQISKRDIFICDNCNNEVNEKDYYCSYCGAVFADSDKKCYLHDKPAMGVCMICKKAFCDECVVTIKNKFFCEEHSNYNFTNNGWASVYETENDDDANIIKENLDDNDVPCTIDNCKDSSFQLAFGLQGSIFVRVPFDFVLKAKEIIQNLDLSLQN